MNAQRQRTSISTLIAWLSVVLLAAAWGHTLDEEWQVIWGQMGAFGLAAAVGLAATERVRVARDERISNRILQARVECGLTRLNEHSAAIDSINAAVRRLAEHAAKRRRVEIANPPRGKRRWQSQLLGDYPLEISPVEDHEEPFDARSVGPIPGSLWQISSQGVSFEHDEAFSTRIVLLTCKLDDDQRLSFVVDVMWTQKTNDGFISGGTVLAVGVPAEHRDAELASAGSAT